METQKWTLEEYLDLIENCPDEKIEFEGNNTHVLTLEYGICDNWLILLEKDIEPLSDYFKNSGKYTLHQNSKPQNPYFDFNAGTVVVGVGWGIDAISRIKLGKVPVISDDFLNEEVNITSIILHPHQRDKEIEGMSRIKAMVEVVKDISSYAMDQGIKLCFPKSIGHRYDEDLSRIVFYNPR